MSKQPPNILFLLPDQHRTDWLGCNPALPLRTPNLDRLCARGTRFTRAYTPSPVCAPARACLASGLRYEQCRVPSNKESFPLDLPTYYQRLRDAGYRVCTVGKLDLHKELAKPRAELDWGLDGSRLLRERGFTEGIDNEGKLDGSTSYRAAGKPKGPYLNFLHGRGLADAYVREHAAGHEHKAAYVTALPDDAYCDNWLSENGLRFLRGFPKGQPWHLVVNFTGPHEPMDVTQAMHEAWKGVSFPPPVANSQADYDAEDHQRNRRYYAAEIENIDRQVGRFIAAVEERGELDNTLVVYSSDHGEMLGDHNLWGKTTWREASAGIPLIAAGPGVRAGVTTGALASLHDLSATFLDYASLPPLPAMDARSLRGVLEGKTDRHRDYVLSALGNWRMAFDGRHKLVLGTDLPEQLYDLQEDPLECRNAAAERPDVVRSMSALLA
jgi:arylsulfatase A-like enzyme